MVTIIANLEVTMAVLLCSLAKLFRLVFCFIATALAEMHCFSSIGSFEPGLNSFVF